MMKYIIWKYVIIVCFYLFFWMIGNDLWLGIKDRDENNENTIKMIKKKQKKKMKFIEIWSMKSMNRLHENFIMK